MESSKCPRCGNTSFETVIETPKNSSFKYQFIRCESCKTVVGVMEYFNVSKLLFNLARKLNINIE